MRTKALSSGAALFPGPLRIFLPAITLWSAASLLFLGCSAASADLSSLSDPPRAQVSGSAGERVLLVVAHQDDDVFIVSRLRRHILSGDTVYVVWTAYSSSPDSAYGNRRLREARSAMRELGVPESNYFFLMEPDGETDLHLGAVIHKLDGLLPLIRPSVVYIPAFEGGHIDHDICHFAAVRALKETHRACRVVEFPIYSALHLFPLLPYMVRNLPSSQPTTCRPLSQEEYLFVLKYWNIYESQHFPLDLYIALTVGRERAFGVEYTRDLPSYDYLHEPDGGPIAYERFLRDVTFADFVRAVERDTIPAP